MYSDVGYKHTAPLGNQPPGGGGVSESAYRPRKRGFPGKRPDGTSS